MITSFCLLVSRRSCDCIGKGCFPEVEERQISQKYIDFQNCSTTVVMTTTDVELQSDETASWLKVNSLLVFFLIEHFQEYIMDSLIVDKLEITC